MENRFEDTAAGITAAEGKAIEARSIEVITAEIVAYKQQAGYACIEIGKCLIEAKEKLSHGEWLPWLSEKIEFSEVTAQRFMRLAREYSNPSPVTDLGPSKALQLLALPESEREGFVAEKHVVDGEEKTVAEMSKRELEKAIRERDEALRRAGDLEEQLRIQMDEQQTTYDTDMADAQGRLEEAQEAKAKAEQTVAELKKELEDLRSAPAPVTMDAVVDQKAINEAVAKAEAKLNAKIEKAEAAKEKAQKAQLKAEQDLSAAKVAQEKANTLAEQEKKTMAEQIQTLQKKLAVASSSDMTVFKLYFDQTKENIDKMVECVQRMTDAGDAEGADRLRKALGALLSAASEAISIEERQG